METETLILGAGLAGLSTAYHLKKRDYLVIEKGFSAGGLARSHRVGDFTVDYTGHLLHMQNPYAIHLVHNLLRNNLEKHIRNSWIYSHKTYTRYPFQVNLYGLPPAVVKECLDGFLEAKIRAGFRDAAPGPFRSFGDWIERSLGRGIARHFMVPYNTKIWTVRPEEMTCEWMGRFVPRPKLADLLRGAFEDTSQRIGYNAHFLYPKRGGIGALANALAENVRNIRFGVKPLRISLKKRMAWLSDGNTVRYKHLVSTIAAPELVDILEEAPQKVHQARRHLRANTVVNLNLGINRGEITDKHWIYFSEPKFIFYRVGFYSNICPASSPKGTTSIYTEVAIPEHAPFHSQKLEKRILLDLRRTGLLRASDKIIMKKLLVIPHAYVIYTRHRTPAILAICNFLKKHGVSSIGRYGGWKYSTMEEALLDGKFAAEAIHAR